LFGLCSASPISPKKSIDIIFCFLFSFSNLIKGALALEKASFIPWEILVSEPWYDEIFI